MNIFDTSFATFEAPSFQDQLEDPHNLLNPSLLPHGESCSESTNDEAHPIGNPRVDMQSLLNARVFNTTSISVIQPPWCTLGNYGSEAMAVPPCKALAGDTDDDFYSFRQARSE